MTKYIVQVTIEFAEEVEAESPESAEDLVRNMDWADIPKLITVSAEKVED